MQTPTITETLSELFLKNWWLWTAIIATVSLPVTLEGVVYQVAAQKWDTNRFLLLLVMLFGISSCLLMSVFYALTIPASPESINSFADGFVFFFLWFTRDLMGGFLVIAYLVILAALALRGLVDGLNDSGILDRKIGRKRRRQ